MPLQPVAFLRNFLKMLACFLGSKTIEKSRKWKCSSRVEPKKRRKEGFFSRISTSRTRSNSSASSFVLFPTCTLSYKLSGRRCRAVCVAHLANCMVSWLGCNTRVAGGKVRAVEDPTKSNGSSVILAGNVAGCAVKLLLLQFFLSCSVWCHVPWRGYSRSSRVLKEQKTPLTR